MATIRLPWKDLKAIKEAFSKHFSKNDHLWIFGSRVDITRKGGDIDLYIETLEEDYDKVYKQKSTFLSDLWDKIGEQKIDIVVNQLNGKKHLPIYDAARNMGVQLSMKEIKLDEAIEVAKIHSERMQYALEKIARYFPITSETIKNLSNDEIAFFDLFTNRFCKLQDLMGSKIFPLLLESIIATPVEKMTFIDILNRLEKLEVIESSEEWKDMRDVRNNLSHEYLLDSDATTKNLNKLYPMGAILLNYLDKVIQYIEKL